MLGEWRGIEKLFLLLCQKCVTLHYVCYYRTPQYHCFAICAFENTVFNKSHEENVAMKFDQHLKH